MTSEESSLPSTGEALSPVTLSVLVKKWCCGRRKSSSSLFRCPSSVNHEVMAGYEAGFIQGKKQRSIPYIFRLSDPANRGVLQEHPCHCLILEHGLCHVSLDHSGIDGIHRDVMLCII